jgi:pimeloyl-ACP methyl ester carboxylesterase
MITFILPGYSAHNKEWAQEVAKNLNLGHEIRPVFWSHWTEPAKTFKPKEKAQDVIDVLLEDNANVIAKSVGTLVAALVLQQIPDRINKIILCGIPSVSDERLAIFKEAFANFPPENVVVFQNTKDPLGSYEEVKKFMASVNPKIKVIEKPRSDHNYPYFSDFQKFLKE